MNVVYIVTSLERSKSECKTQPSVALEGCIISKYISYYPPSRETWIINEALNSNMLLQQERIFLILFACFLLKYLRRGSNLIFLGALIKPV